MKINKNIFRISICLVMLSCNSDKRIIKLLNSKNKIDIILGADRAGESGKKEFVPYLLKNAADWRVSTNLGSYGVTVYQAKMEALRKILKVEPPPPLKITYKPDSLIIKFYSNKYDSMDEKKW